VSALLPVGAIVRVTERHTLARPPYVAEGVGYDIGRTRCHLGARYGGWGEWLFADGGRWAFLDEVEPCAEGQ
jgi:hypothetical protein